MCSKSSISKEKKTKVETSQNLCDIPFVWDSSKHKQAFNEGLRPLLFVPKSFVAGKI